MRVTMLFMVISLAHACSVIFAGRKATADGSTLLFHTDDCANCDFRLGRVHPSEASASARVLHFRPEYPREVSTRSDTYARTNLDTQLPANVVAEWSDDAWTDGQTLGMLDGFEPSVAAALGIDMPNGQTYGTLEGLYSIVNTAQVAVVETTGSSNPTLLFNPARPSKA